MLNRLDLIRSATPDDADDMARLVNFAGEGLPLYFWSLMTNEGEDPWEVGRERAGRQNGSFSYCNAQIAEHGGAVAGALVSYRIGDTPEVIGPDMPEILKPLQELENEALGSQYVNVLAVYPQYRLQGFGRRLLREAEARAEGRQLSIIVSDANGPAMRLYGTEGYRPKTARAIVKSHGWSCAGLNWVLMVKPGKKAG